MKKILLPIDLNGNAKKVCNYALQLAEELRAHVHLLHICNEKPAADLPSFTRAQKLLAVGVATQTNPQAERKLQQIRQSILDENWNIPGISIEIVHGKTEEEIIYASHRIQPDLIAMGTRGKSKVYKTFFGSATAYVIEKANIPVLSFPVDITYKGIKNILYASSFDEADHISLERLYKLTAHLNPRIYVVHIVKAPSACTQSLQDYLCHKLQQHISSRFPLSNFVVNVLCTSNHQEALSQAIHEHEIQLLVTTTRKRSVDQHLNDPSFTRYMLYNMQVPLLSFHNTEYNLLPDFYEDYY